MIKSNDVAVTVSNDHLRVSPGEEVQLTVTVHNESTAIDVFRIEVNGLEEQWGRPNVLAQTLRPHPGRPEDPCRDCRFESNLSIKPPRNSSALAGTRNLKIIATRDRNPQQEAVVPVTLEVLPFYAYDLSLIPEETTSARGSYSLEFLNTGNSDLHFDVKGRDRENLCRFFFLQESSWVESASVWAHPGEDKKLNLPVSVEPVERPFRGRPKAHDFTITTTPHEPGLAPREIRGKLNSISRVAGWRRRVNSFLRRPIGTPSIPSFGIPTWVWLVCGAALVTVVVLAIIVVLTAGANTQVTQFDILPGEAKSYVLPFPDSRVVRVEGSAQWQGSGGDLEMNLLRPDGTRAALLLLSPSALGLTFTIDEEVGGQGPEGWVLSLHNQSASDQARGTLRINSSAVR